MKTRFLPVLILPFKMLALSFSAQLALAREAHWLIVRLPHFYGKLQRAVTAVLGLIQAKARSGMIMRSSVSEGCRALAVEKPP